MKCELRPCRSDAEFLVHRDGGLNLRYCVFHKNMAIDICSSIDIPLRVQRILMTKIIKGNAK